MSYVLSIVLPPKEGAAFGKSKVFESGPTADTFATVSAFMTKHFGSLGPVNLPGSLAYRLVNNPTGTDVSDPATGCTFRVDPEDRAPNSCPCCGRLVKWGDHALAGSDDAYCQGCYTWDRGSDPCLPENTAHTEEP